MRTPPADAFLAATDVVRDRVLVRGSSLCRSRDRLWRDPHLADLSERLRAAATAASGGLDERWQAALEGAPSPVVRLAAEALAVHLLVAADIRGDTKRRHIAAILARLDEPVALHRTVDAALDHGPASTGVAFKRRRLSQVLFLVRAARAWRALPAAARRDALADPWAFRTWLAHVPVDGAAAQREALLHLVHPATFEPVTSPTAKRRIVAALGRAAERDLDTDEALVAIRARLTAAAGSDLSFGRPPLVDRWLHEPADLAGGSEGGGAGRRREDGAR